jgi:hypothetical protein
VAGQSGALLERFSSELDDPAAAFAQSVRLAIRVARNRPQLAQILVRHGLTYLGSDYTFAPRLLSDINAAIAADRFKVDNPRLAVAATVGSVLAAVRMMVIDPEFAAQPSTSSLPSNCCACSACPSTRRAHLRPSPCPIASASSGLGNGCRSPFRVGDGVDEAGASAAPALFEQVKVPNRCAQHSRRVGVGRCMPPVPAGVRRSRSAERRFASGVEQLPVPFGDDLNGAADHFDGRLIGYRVCRHR